MKGELIVTIPCIIIHLCWTSRSFDFLGCLVILWVTRCLEKYFPLCCHAAIKIPALTGQTPLYYSVFPFTETTSFHYEYIVLSAEETQYKTSIVNIPTELVICNIT